MKNLKILALVLLLPSVSGFANTCENLKFEAEEVRQEIQAYQADLHEAAPSSKPYIVAQIRALNRQLIQIGNQLRQQNCG
ncbi:MAG: hypothetical protein M3Q07_19210 [Pseudobdellovibrionaceae bacterium]|nr:hypothetical protein [Pseudobdellovibrionaceae bacterium]